MIGGLFDTIANSIDSVGSLLGWAFVGAVIIFAFKGGNGSGKSNTPSAS